MVGRHGQRAAGFQISAIAQAGRHVVVSHGDGHGAADGVTLGGIGTGQGRGSQGVGRVCGDRDVAGGAAGVLQRGAVLHLGQHVALDDVERKRCTHPQRGATGRAIGVGLDVRGGGTGRGQGHVLVARQLNGSAAEDPRLGVQVGHVDGHRAGHAGLAAAGAGPGLGREGMGGVAQGVRVTRARAGQRQGLALERILARGGELDVAVAQQDHVIGAVVRQATHVVGTAHGAAVADRVAGLQMVALGRLERDHVVGRVEDDVVGELQEIGFELVAGAGARAGEIDGITVTRLVFGLGQLDAAAFADDDVIDRAVVQAADLVVGIAALGALVGHLVARGQAVAVAQEDRVLVRVDHGVRLGFDGCFTRLRHGPRAVAVGRDAGRAVQVGTVDDGGHIDRDGCPHRGAALAHGGTAVGRGLGVGVVLGQQADRAVGTAAARGDIDARTDGGVGGAVHHVDGHRAGHADLGAAAAAIALGGFGAGIAGVGTALAAGPCGFLIGAAGLAGDLLVHVLAVFAAFGVTVRIVGLLVGRAGHAGLGLGTAGRGGLGAEGHGAAGGEVTRGAGHGAVGQHIDGQRNAHAGVARFGVTLGDGLRTAFVAGAQRDVVAHRERAAQADRGLGVVVAHGHHDHRRDRRLALGAAGAGGQHLVGGIGLQREVHHAGGRDVVAQQGLRIGLAHVDGDGRAHAHATAALGLARGLGGIGHAVLGPDRDVAADDQVGTAGHGGACIAQAHVDGQAAGHAGVTGTGARGGTGQEGVRLVAIHIGHHGLDQQPAAGDAAVAHRGLVVDQAHVDRHGDADTRAVGGAHVQLVALAAGLLAFLFRQGQVHPARGLALGGLGVFLGVVQRHLVFADHAHVISGLAIVVVQAADARAAAVAVAHGVAGRQAAGGADQDGLVLIVHHTLVGGVELHHRPHGAGVGHGLGVGVVLGAHAHGAAAADVQAVPDGGGRCGVGHGDGHRTGHLHLLALAVFVAGAGIGAVGGAGLAAAALAAGALVGEVAVVFLLLVDAAFVFLG